METRSSKPHCRRRAFQTIYIPSSPRPENISRRRWNTSERAKAFWRAGMETRITSKAFANPFLGAIPSPSFEFAHSDHAYVAIFLLALTLARNSLEEARKSANLSNHA